MMTETQKKAVRILGNCDGVVINGTYISRASCRHNDRAAETVLATYTPEFVAAEIERWKQYIETAKAEGQSLMAISGYRSAMQDMQQIQKKLAA